MTRLKWGEGPRLYDQGLDNGVLYLDGTAVPWNGLVSVDEKEAGSIDTEHYFDGNRVYISKELGDFGAKISAFTYPDAFSEYNGYSERNIYERFGFSYRTQHGDGHKIHLVYNVLVRDSSRDWTTVSNSPDPSLFNWDIYGTAIPIPGASPASRLTMEAPNDPTVLSRIEDILYGTASTEPRLPDPGELIELYEASMILRITQNGDGTYTASGPDSVVRLLDDGRFEIDAPSAFLLAQGIFIVNSY